MPEVSVTGITGFIAAHVTRDLLKRGYTVRGTVRSIPKAESVVASIVEGLAADAAARLHLYEADLLSSSAFDSVFNGVDGIFHLASPFFIEGVVDAADAEKRLLEPAVAGTRNVMDAANRMGVKRIVLTSSMAAVRWVKEKPSVFTEEHWSDVPAMREAGGWYPLSKTLAEQEAWSLAEKYQMKLRVINPCLVWGPLLTPHLNTSHLLLQRMVTSALPKIDNSSIEIVDVRDVSMAHILCYEAPDDSEAADGRHVCAPHAMSRQQLVEVIREIEPNAMKGKDLVLGEGETAAPVVNVDCDKLRRVGVEFVSLKECCQASVDSLRKYSHI